MPRLWYFRLFPKSTRSAVGIDDARTTPRSNPSMMDSLKRRARFS